LLGLQPRPVPVLYWCIYLCELRCGQILGFDHNGLHFLLHGLIPGLIRLILLLLVFRGLLPALHGRDDVSTLFSGQNLSFFFRDNVHELLERLLLGCERFHFLHIMFR